MNPIAIAVIVVSGLVLALIGRALFKGKTKASKLPGVAVHLDTYVEIDGQKRVGSTREVSEQGAFVAVQTEGLTTGQRLFVQMHVRANKFLRLLAYVKALTPDGIEVTWASSAPDDKVRLAELMSEGARQDQLRTPFKLKATFTWEEREHVCDVHNITTVGCYLDDKERVLQPSDKVMLSIELNPGNTIEVVGEVMWLHGDATIVAVTHFVGLALEFRDLSHADEKKIEERLAQS